jgi:eukaryotic-like serine/threonine-protein kinase
MSSLLICPECHHWEAAQDTTPTAESFRCRVCGAVCEREHVEPSSRIEGDFTQKLHPVGTADSIAVTLHGVSDEVGVSVTTSPVVPGYDLLYEIGRGGMGVVFKARQLSLNRIVALKMLLGGRFADPNNVARFNLEAEAAARLRHPNIVQVYDVGSHNGQPYFAMEYVDGESFARRYAGPIAPAEASRVVAELARAVHHAHEEGVVHRDLKPANILLTRDGRLKITDFGLARRLDLPYGVTVSGTFVGTPEYMAPEQAGGRAVVGPAVDIYALGVLLYEMLTGRAPFTGSSVWETLERVRELEPVPPGRLRGRIPRDLETVCLKCLHKDPHRRYGSALELAEDLERFLRGESVRARPVGTAHRVWRLARRRPAVAALIAVTVLVFLIGLPTVTVLWLQAARERSRAAALAVSLAEALEMARSERAAADRLRDEAEQRETRLALERGLALCEDGEVARGLLWLARALELAERPGQPDESMRRAVRVNLAAWRARLVLPGRLFPHPQTIHAVAFTADSKTLLTGSNLALRWNVETGELGGALNQNLADDFFTCWAVAANGRNALTTRANGTARLWDLETAKFVGAPLSHPLRTDVWCAALAPDGQSAATGAGDGRVRFWEVPSGKLLGMPFGHVDAVSALAYSPDGKLLLTGSWDRTARLWRIGEARPLAAPPMAHADKLLGVAFSPDGTLVCTACRDGSAQLWDPTRPERVGEPFRHLDECTGVAFSPDGGLLLTGSRDDTARLWELHSGRPVGLALTHDGDVLAVGFAPDGSVCVVGGQGGCRLWRLPRRLTAGPPLGGHRLAVDSLGVSGDGRVLFSGSRANLSLREVATGRTVAEVESRILLRDSAYDPVGGAVAVAPWPRDVQFWDVGRSRPGEPHEVRPAAPLEGGAQMLTFTPDGQRLAVVSVRKPEEVLVWDVRAGHWLEPTIRCPQPVTALAVSGDGARLLTASADKMARIWDVQSGKSVGEPLPNSDAVTAVAFAANGHTLATGCRDGTLRLWNAVNGPPLTIVHHRGVVLAVAFAPDGRSVASASADQTARVWDAATGVPLGPTLWHRDAVQAVLFTPDGRTLVTGSRDRTVQRWQMSADAAEGPAAGLRREIERLTGLTLNIEGAGGPRP